MRPMDDAAARRHGAAREFAYRVKVADICEALERAGVEAVLIKGPAFKARLYSPSEDRPSSDYDLLIDPAHRPVAERTLRELGFRAVVLPEDQPTALAAHVGHWLRDSDGTHLDLHENLPEVTGDPEHHWQLLKPHRTRLELAGRAVDVLDDVASALLIALHAAHHGPTLGWKPLSDLRRALAQMEPEVWTSAHELAEALGAGAAFADGLSLLPEGLDRCRQLGLSPDLDVRRRLLWADAAGGAISLDDLQRRRGLSRAALVARLLVPTPRMLRVTSPIARRGRLGLAVAYATRPVYLARRLPPAVRALRRARRGA